MIKTAEAIVELGQIELRAVSTSMVASTGVPHGGRRSQRMRYTPTDGAGWLVGMVTVIVVVGIRHLARNLDPRNDDNCRGTGGVDAFLDPEPTLSAAVRLTAQPERAA